MAHGLDHHERHRKQPATRRFGARPVLVVLAAAGVVIGPACGGVFASPQAGSAPETTPAPPTTPDGAAPTGPAAPRRGELAKPQPGRIYRGRDGNVITPGYEYVRRPVPRLPLKDDWLGAAARAGVDVSNPAVAGSLQASLAARCADEQRRRDALFLEDTLEMSREFERTGRAITTEDRRAAEIVVRASDEIRRMVERDAEGLRTAIYAAHALRPELPPLDDDRVARAVALDTRRALREVFPFVIAFRWPRILALDLEQLPGMEHCLEWSDPAVVDSLRAYERESMARMLAQLAAGQAFIRSMVDRPGEGDPLLFKRYLDAIDRTWDLEVAAVDAVRLPDARAQQDLRMVRRSQLLQPCVTSIIASRRLDALAIDAPEVQELARTIQGALERAIAASQAAFRTRYREWTETRFHYAAQEAENGRYWARMHAARAEMGTTVAGAIAAYLAAHPEATPDATAAAGVGTAGIAPLLEALQPIGAWKQGGPWALLPLEGVWPGPIYNEPR